MKKDSIKSRKVARAFVNKKIFRAANVTVRHFTSSSYLTIHGLKIAIIDMDKGLRISNCGHLTPMIKKYLNALLDEFSYIKMKRIFQKNYCWYWEDKEGNTYNFPSNEYISLEVEE